MQFPLTAKERQFASWISQRIQAKMDWVADKNKDKLPYTTGSDGSYDDHSANGMDASWWTNGFWGGLMWQLYHRTGEAKYKQYAALCEEKLDRCFDTFSGLNHDVGFMWLPTAVTDYQITKDLLSRTRALHAACLLAGRFNPSGRFLRAWDDLPDQDTRGWAIIDCMMNIPLLFWASRETNDPRFAQVATQHADTVQKSFVRQNGSVCHIVEFDPVSGARVCSHGGQGYGHGSAWTRGQGWALYGFSLAYRYTQDEAYLHTAEKVARYCLSALRPDGFVPIDFCQPADAPQEDNCGACVIACGMLELYEQTKDESLRRQCLEVALHILHRVAELRSDWTDRCDAIVQFCSASWQNGVNMTMCYADYFFAEAIFRLEGKAFRIF